MEEKSVLAFREWQEKCYGVLGMVKEVFLGNGSDKKTVLGTPSQDQRAEQNTVVTYDDSAPFIRGNHN